jgi:dienelactone hydrolase
MRTALLLALPALLSAAQPATRDVAFTTPDGFEIKGTFALPGRPGKVPVVILAHQFRSDRSGWKPLVDSLHAHGIATLALDLRGHGLSTKKGDATVAVTEDFKASSEAVGFDRIPTDLVQAAAWVRKQPGVDGRRLGLAGSSVGAYSVLAASPRIHPVAVLALSPAGGWGDNPEARLVKATRAARATVFVAASEGDAHALANAKALKSVFGVYARIRPGDEHGFAYLPDLTPTFAGWFGEVLGRHGAPAKARAKAKPLEMPAE